MKSLFLCAFLALVVLVLAPAVADALVVSGNWDVHFDFQGKCANDFHAEGLIHSAGGSPPTITNIFVFGDLVQK